MKTALVLSGGGAKGAYEAGAIKALRELGYDFDIVTGTSIGALNGLLVVQQDYQALYQLWDELTLENVMTHPINFDMSIESLISQSNLIKTFFKSYLNEKGADITPLKNLIHGLYKPDQATNSPIDYGVVTVRFPQLTPIQITRNEMTKDNIVEYAIASASCFPAFPAHNIEGQGYIDGGYYDNLPIALASQMGATQIIAIELNQEATHDYLLNYPHITFIRPSVPLKGFLDFNRDILDWRIQLGYYDTLKTFGKYKGFRYTFIHKNNFKKQYLEFYHLSSSYEIRLNDTLISNKTNTQNHPLLDKLIEGTYLSKIPTIEDAYLLELERLLDKYEYPHHEIYDVKVIQKELYQSFKKEDLHNRDLPEISLKNINTLLKQLTSKQIISYFYHHFIDNDGDSKIPISLFINEYLEALFYYVQI